MHARVRFVIFLRSDFCVIAFLFVYRCGLILGSFVEAVSQMVSPRTIACVILTPLSVFEARIGVFSDG